MHKPRSGFFRSRSIGVASLAIAVAVLAGLRVPRSATASAAYLPAAKPAVERPPIVGVAHIGLRTDNLAAAREFYGHVLGFAEAFSLDNPGGGLMLTCFKVNDHQYVEIFPELKSPTEDRLSHIAFETTDANRLRDYLASRGVEVPALLKPGRDGNLSFMVKDPDGHNVEFVQYMPGSLHSRNFGKFLPATRVSDHMIHVGVTVADRAAADRFYGDILGFKLMWYGGMKDNRVDWADMRVPEGTDWLEYMLGVHNPSPRTLGVMHHFALGVAGIQPAYQTVLARGYKAEKPQIGRDGKWQLNLYDPDLTRAELMEFKPVQKPCCSPMITP
ncbi:MAG TPA: VOC family protein [Terriglobia bacterium]|nr:VOC family protein [Terriglobia bacterium]